MEKRGSFSFLAGVIILLIGAFAVISVITIFMLKASDKEAENLCHDSILLRAKTTLNVDGAEKKLTPPLCKTIDKKVSGKQEEVKKTFADLAARCWWMWGEGKYENIVKEGFWETLGLNTDNPCFVCYAVALDEGSDFKGGNIISGQEFLDFTANQKYKKGSDITFQQYVTSSAGPGRLLVFSHFQPQHAYGIAFAAKNKEPQMMTDIVTAAAGAGIATASIFLTGGIALPLAIAAGGLVGLGSTGLIADLQSEREVSTIYIDGLSSMQGYCYQGDLGGD